MKAVKELIPWKKLQGYLPTIIQDIDTLEVLCVSQMTQPVFDELIENLPYFTFGSPHDIPEPFAQALYVDCDEDCLLTKVWATLEQRKESRTFFQPLGQDVPVDLFGKSKLILAVTQDVARQDVLMAAFMDEEALRLTLSTRFVHYFSRKRKKLWKKGEESGNVQHLIAGRYDPKAHAVVLDIRQEGGAACHEGYRTCFFRRIDPKGNLVVVGERVFDPKTIYKN